MTEWLRLLAVEAGEWAERLQALPAEETIRAMRALVAAWVDGELEPALLGPSPTLAALRGKRALLAALLSALSWAWTEIERTADTDEQVRRWCWIEAWL